MLTEMIKYRQKMIEYEGRGEGYTKQNKEKYTGDQQWREGNWGSNQSINDLEQKEEINIQLERNEETRIQKNEERLRNLWDNFKRSNIWTIGVPERQEEEQEVENLFEEIMKENFPSLVKELDM